MNEQAIIERAKELGFSDAAFMDVKDLTIVPEYRKYCEMNSCGMYGVNPKCPPMSGTVEEMTGKVKEYSRVLVLQTVLDAELIRQMADGKTAKKDHNALMDVLVEELEKSDAGEFFCMSAGPSKRYSCMSAYCVDAQKMADCVGMKCWANDGLYRFFSQILFK